MLQEGANISVDFASRFVIGVDGSQTGILALGPTVGLETEARVAGNLLQVMFQLLHQLLESLRLVFGHKRVNGTETSQ